MRYWVAIAVGVATALWFAYSRLAFAPVPWPDASAFYLPGRDLIAWPPRWIMHAQAAFVPTYDQANFNTMPLLPLLLGLGAKLGLERLLGATEMTRAVSLVALVGWAYLLWKWLLEALESGPWCASDFARPARPTGRVALVLATLTGLAALWDPVMRWGTLVVRTETWVGLAWVYLIRELARLAASDPSVPERRALWRMSGALAFAAYFHFEAIVLVPATAVGLLPSNLGKDPKAAFAAWGRRLGGISWRTLALLSPWILYVAANFGLFLTQMETQFFRLENHNEHVRDLYGLFHSLFISHGSPKSWPKFFNVGKGVFWATVILLTIRTTLLAIETLRGRVNAWAPQTAAAGLMFWTSFYLWATKPEIWFTVLCHLAVWPWVAIVLLAHFSGSTAGRKTRVALTWLTGAYAALALLTTIAQSHQISPKYSMLTYRRWIDCIDQMTQAKPRIWQPYLPDVLVELASRRGPAADLTRALDFPREKPRAWELTKRLDAIVFSRYFDNPEDPLPEPVYSGPERPQDRELLMNTIAVPFGDWALERLPREQPGDWAMRVCKVGPFWANIAVRR